MKDMVTSGWRSIMLTAVMLLAIGAWAQDGWPVRFEADGIQYQLFSPQPESMNGNQFSARAAISMQRPEDRSPIFGALWGDGKLELDRDSRLGSLIHFNVKDARFPGVENEQELAQLRQGLSTAIPAHAPPISIDWMIAALEEENSAGDQYVNDPPEIIYREKPTTLVFIDGEPIYEELDATVAAKGDPLYQPKSRSRLERVLNTPFMILRRDGADHYLYGSGMWFRSRTIDGTWQRDNDVPAELQKLASQADEAAALTADNRPVDRTPEIMVRFEPAEMLDLDGPPELQPVQNSSLLTVTNTNRSVFMDIGSQDYYFLASGRWFRTRDLSSGNWEFVPADKLPPAFSTIPEGSNRDMVLAHVAGTDAAREAARDAHIPQTAKVDRNSANVEVNYQGSPSFERIAGTNVEHARNASTEVFRINGYYHVCDNGVWFEGPTPDGPWVVSTVVPEEVQSIPPSSPAYNVRYVYIYDHTPDIVYMGYTPGYLGSFVQHGVVVYGTGYYYRPHPVFWRPRPWTWGMHMYYDPWIGWGFGYGYGYNWFNPYWGMGMWGHPYAWGGGWWGPYAWHPPCCVTTQNTHYGHRPSVTGRTSRSGSTGDTQRAIHDNNVYAARERGGVTPSTISRAPAGQTAQDGTQSRKEVRQQSDHFTDAAGNVYRQSGDRTQRYDDGSWNRVSPPVDQSGQARPAQTPIPAQRDPQGSTPDRTGQQPQVQPPTNERGGQPQAHPQTSQTRPDPHRIQQDRQRGIQRQQNFQRNAPQRASPAPRPSGGRSPGGVSPSPGRSPGVSPGGGGGSAPSRGGGGGGRNR